MNKPELTDEVGVYLYAQNLVLRHAIIILAGIYFADVQANRDKEYSLALRKVFDEKLRSVLTTAFNSDNVIQESMAKQAIEDLIKELKI